MSKIGRKPITLPQGVTVTVKDNQVLVKGPKGELSQKLCGDIKVTNEEGKILVERGDDAPQNRAYHGLFRSLIENMIIGTSNGFTITLELVGTGYRAQLQGKKLTLNVGFSHSVEVEIPDGIEGKMEGQNKIMLSSIDKQKVGQFAADVRKIRPPEPYQGKGIKYDYEQVRRKAGKTGK